MEERDSVAVDHCEPDNLDAKIVEAFPGKVVRKDLTAVMKRGANVPTFVLEYLLGMYCSTDDPGMVEQGLARIRKILAENYVRPDESERIKSKIWELRQYTIIDKVSVRFDEYRGIHVATFANLSIDPVVMPEDYVRSYPKMLCGGMWCILRMEYFQLEDELNDELADVFGGPKPIKMSKNSGPEDNPYRIGNLTPIQMPNIDMGDIISQRKAFTTEEWMDLLLRSAGYEPSSLDLRTKLHFIERMVPLAERNYNLCELGPRGTGKSHIYNEISPYAILLSGGQTTTANLFGRLNASAKKSSSLERTGLVGNWDVVTFDEVAGMHFKDMNAIQILKGYMAGGAYARGRESFSGDASMVFEGNINDSVQNVLKTTHLFDPFPPEFNEDSAFFDRIHYYLPGWEVPKMRSDLLTKRYGLITDCLSEFCKGMRKRDYTHHLDDFFRLNGDFNTRDEIGVRKTFSGLMKLLFPDEKMTHDDAKMILDYAIEGRRRVKEQLKIMAGIEFMDVNLGYSELDNPAAVTIVGVPEQSDNSLVPEAPLQPGHVFGIGRSIEGKHAVYKLENKAIAGSCHFQYEGIGSRSARESIDAAWSYFVNNANRVAAGMHLDKKDYLLFFNDLQAKGPSDEVSLAEFVGLCSAACNRPVAAGLVIPGVLRLSGSMDEIKGLEDILRVAKNAGAKRILLPFGAIKDLQAIPMELASSVSPDFYPDGDAVSAARKALGI
ncbi:protease Lon-related BREX system protein BrxL [uncultured Senegalimassilia sp.]|uniref:protease Lon-related BREX system protein BrxL n=1 Tax=uncultured Senegalimassilia sp. TaxID=1714350 RepID=UPI0025D496A5|nr:protease Lon-related BREX system protein BrxL [uncultured Senegalimassilia sp.]